MHLVVKIGVPLFAALAASALYPSPAQASCQCSCVNGQVQPVCTSSIDVRPVCSPRICPIVPPAVRPIATPVVPPVGTRSCRMEQVLNPNTGQYEWRSICR